MATSTTSPVASHPQGTSTSAAAPPLVIERMSFAWPGHAPLLEIDHLDARRGEKIFLYGPSGSGKSTLLALVAGIQLPVAGSVTVFGQRSADLSAAARDRLRGDRMGFVFQQFNLIPYLSVLDNVRLPLRFSKMRRERVQAAGDPVEIIRGLLGRLEIDAALLERTPAALSVGQQQRVAVARALLGAPELVICDEPTSALDADATHGFLEVLADACAQARAALLFVSHDRGLTGHFDREIDMRDLTPAPRPPC